MVSRKLLIITYYWPPSGGVGVQRWINFAKQLQEKGWEPIILTPENPQFEIKDEKLVDKVAGMTTYKLPIWEPFKVFHKLTGGKERKNVQQGLVMEKSHKSFVDRLSVWIRGNIFLPDPRVFWVRSAARFASKLVKNQDISTIITTGPPHSMHLIGRKVKKETGVKWLADFRDPWSKWDVLQKLNTSSLAMKVHEYLESAVLQEADEVITVSNRLAKSLGSAQVVNNGISVVDPTKEPLDTNQFTIGYFGMLNELRNPKQFWLLLDQMCREDTEFGKKLQVRIGGIISESIKEELEQLQQLKDKVHFLGYLSHQQVQQEYRKCNVLLLLLNKSNNSQWILPVKFFEYLAARSMVLCLGPRDSDLGEIMHGKDLGDIFAYKEIALIRAFLEDVMENERVPDATDVSELIKQFSHTHLAEKLDQLLTNMNEH